MLDKWIRGILTVGLVGACAYLWATGREAPEVLVAFAGAGLGQYLPRPGSIRGGGA